MRTTRSLAALAGPLAVALAAASPAAARPSGPQLFCDAYPESSTCAGRGTTCTTCHTSTSPQAPDWNAYGFAILDELGAASLDFDADGALAGVLVDIEGDDADGDGLSNLEEILLGTLPGDASSFFREPTPGQGADNPAFAVGAWDPRFAYRRTMIAFCGRSPTFDEVNDVDDREDVHAALDACLASGFWTNEGLSRLADERVRPIDFTRFFDWDYRMWRYVMTGDRDIRDLLTATYHVREASPGELTEIVDVVDDGNACNNDNQCAFDSRCNNGTCRFIAEGQALVPAERAGMIGTAWFHFINTMFSAMPRTTAAQAMRGYLGMDIARQQGIAPIAGEPLDVDAKGVAQAECAQCHSTLDPATYVFAKYNGIGGGAASALNPNRPILLGLWGSAAEEPQSTLLGQPVSSLAEWGAVAAQSEAFRVNMARVLFEHALGRATGPAENEELEALWRSWDSLEVAWSASRFLHEVIDTNAFGAP